MQVSKQFLLEAASLTLVVALILISVQIFQRATHTVQVIEEKQEKQLQYLEEYEIIQYDGYCIPGSTAVCYIKNMVANYEIPVTVTIADMSFVISNRSQYSDLRNLESDYYINPLGQFRCEITRDDNQSINGVSISYVKKES